MDKREEKRHQKIIEASLNEHWEKVSHLLDQPMENALRRDRYHKTVSLNNKITVNTSNMEYIDIIADSTVDALNQLIEKEEINQVKKAFISLSEQEQQIVNDYCLEEESFSKISKKLGISDKTVKKRLEGALKKLKTIILSEK